MPANDKPVVLIVEDEEQHFRAIAHNLGDYHCVHVNAHDFPDLESIVRKWRPVAAVVDILLYTSGQAQAQADTDAKKYSAWLEDLAKGIRRPGPKYDSHSDIVCKSGADSIRIIRQESPGAKIVICSREFTGDQPSRIDALAENSDADGAIAKEFDPYPTLSNGEAIARKVRELIG